MAGRSIVHFFLGSVAIALGSYIYFTMQVITHNTNYPFKLLSNQLEQWHACAISDGNEAASWVTWANPGQLKGHCA